MNNNKHNNTKNNTKNKHTYENKTRYKHSNNH